MSNMTSPGSGNLELMQRIEALENENKQLKGIILWENPAPDAEMDARTITLASDNYDYYEIYYAITAGSPRLMSQKSYKNKGCCLCYASYGGSGVSNYRRLIDFADDTTIKIGTCGGATSTTNTSVVSNNVCVPLRIIGYKSIIPSTNHIADLTVGTAN